MSRPAHLATLVAALSLAACSDAPDVSRIGAPSSALHNELASPRRYSYLVLSRENAADPALSDAIAQAGARVVWNLPQIGVALVESGRVDFAVEAERLPGVESITPDVELASTEKPLTGLPTQDIEDPAPAAAVAAAVDGTLEPLYPLQWSLRAIDAPGAWRLGYTGRGVRVAVLDAGLNPNHPDLKPNVNVALSTSFVPGETFSLPASVDARHGSLVSGIIAGAVNGVGIAGIAPDAELVMVKVLSARNGTATAGSIVAGIVYAADIGAQVINMSFGGTAPRRAFWAINRNGTPEDPSDDFLVHVTGADNEARIRAQSRATTYAMQKGVIMFAGAGNDSTDFDHNADMFRSPQELPFVYTIGPLGPIGSVLDPNTNLDLFPTTGAFKPNYGQSLLDLSAPGGNADLGVGPNVPPLCSKLGVTFPCVAFDGVYSSAYNGYFFGFGGSFAAPEASGVAALIIERYQGLITPAQVMSILKRTADDLGKPGQDDFYGAGRINARRAVE
jgi:lantibiotic leader peptide-processing serine protease